VAAEEEDGQADDTQGEKKRSFFFVFFTKFPSPKQTKYLAPVGCRMITKGGLEKYAGLNV